MSPVRIVILAVLFYILYRLIFGGKRKKKARPVPSRGPRGKLASQDVLVEDPVCHTYIPQKQAVHAVKDGKTYYFCSERCCQTFLKDEGEKS